MFIMGLGLGLVMQVLVLAVQNAVDYSELGVATSGATLFRSLGGSLGTAALGAVFTARLADVPPTAGARYISAFTSAVDTVFVVAAAIIVVAFLLAWLIEERPLRQTVDTAGVGEAFASPTSGDSLRELMRELSRLVGRERTARSSSARWRRRASTCRPRRRGCSSRARRARRSASPR